MADAANIRKTIREHRPDITINATAYTAVDQAEQESKLAEAINGNGPGILAEETHKLGALLIHFSTDYVFDGQKSTPYVETDSPNPLNVYGLSKLHGEQAIQQVDCAYLIFRTSWVYSLQIQGGFVNKVLQWAHQKKALRIVNDQITNPTWARMLAEITTLVLARSNDDLKSWMTELKGLYHLAGDGFTSRYEWAKLILELDPKRDKHKTKEIFPAMTRDFPAAAQRPLFSALDCTSFKRSFNYILPSWQQALTLAMDTVSSSGVKVD
jgi:dTDP-4-dehydrorhamnose reductase